MGELTPYCNACKLNVEPCGFDGPDMCTNLSTENGQRTREWALELLGRPENLEVAHPELSDLGQNQEPPTAEN